MKNLRKILFFILLYIMVNFGGRFLFWHIWYQVKYAPLTAHMTEVEMDKSYADYHAKKYFYTDEDGYRYVLLTPSYLNYYGEKMLLTYGDGENFELLLIEPQKFSSDFDYSIAFGDPPEFICINSVGQCQFNENNDYIVENGVGITYDQYMEKHQDEINLLLKKANAIWPLQ